jgi:N-acetylglutamate synthase-like GNAT family acetyltransferase
MITNYSVLDENFVSEIEDFSENEIFKLYYLYAAIQDVNSGKVKLLKAYSIKEKAFSAIGVVTNKAYYLYGKNWKEENIEQISKISNLKNCPENFEFFGTEKFINELFKFDGKELNVIKNRSLYKINRNNFTEFQDNINIRDATNDDTIGITHLYQEYYAEEYNGMVLKDFNVTKEKVIDLIKNKSIIISEINELITGFCTTIYKGTDLSMVGTIFVDSEERNKGIGISLANYATKDLLRFSDKVFLMTT